MRFLSILTLLLVMMQGGVCSLLCAPAVASSAAVSDMQADAGDAHPCHSEEESNASESDGDCCAGSGELLISSSTSFDSFVPHSTILPPSVSLLSELVQPHRAAFVAQGRDRPHGPSDLRIFYASFLI